MANDDQGNLVSRLQSDNATAQRVRCGGCSRPMAQNDGEITGANLVNVPGKKIANTDKQAQGFLCNTCLKDEAKTKEGPRTAVFVSPSTGVVGEIYFDNLVDESAAGKLGDKDTEVQKTGTNAPKKVTK